MNLKRIKIISAVATFILCFLTHFAYTTFPNTLFSIFFPVNESIWEHMKMLYTTILLYSIIEYLILKYFHIKHNNFLLSKVIEAIISIPIYLLMFLPYYYRFGENMIIIFGMILITYFIVELIGYKIMNYKSIKYNNLIAIIIIIICYIVFGYLTYNPIKNHLFLDTYDEKYGINDYNI